MIYGSVSSGFSAAEEELPLPIPCRRLRPLGLPVHLDCVQKGDLSGEGDFCARKKDAKDCWWAISDRCFDLCPVSELPKANDDLPEAAQCELQQLVRSIEFRSLRFRIDQMRFSWEHLHKFTLHIISALFSTP
jgi:hypothetical protein